MIKLENFEVMGWEHAIRGMRNPMNSWEKSDTGWVADSLKDLRPAIDYDDEWGMKKAIGPNDHELMMKLAKGGPVHAKYRRMITVYVDITAPLYWWKEFDTYKVGTVANSCSTMHKIHAKEFTLEDFSHEKLSWDEDDVVSEAGLAMRLNWVTHYNYLEALKHTISALNSARNHYLIVGEMLENAGLSDADRKQLTCQKRYYWDQMIQLLPSSYNQKRTVMLNYEVLHNIYISRKNHKLDEWREFCAWIEKLPYSEIVTGHKDGTPIGSPVSYKYSASIDGKTIDGYVTVPENPTDDEVRRAILDTICDGLSYEKNGGGR